MELIRDKVLSTKDGVLLLDGYPRNMSNYNVIFHFSISYRLGKKSWVQVAMLLVVFYINVVLSF